MAGQTLLYSAFLAISLQPMANGFFFPGSECNRSCDRATSLSRELVQEEKRECEAVCQTLLREYARPLTEQEIKDITYIITTLANKPMAKILLYKASLDRAGSRIEQVHPLRFLECVFTSELLKAGIRSIRKRGWIWRDFSSGFGRSMEEEQLKGNLTEEQIFDFSQLVGIDPWLLIEPIEKKNWPKVIDLLIKHLPREEDCNRYDFSPFQSKS